MRERNGKCEEWKGKCVEGKGEGKDGWGREGRRRERRRREWNEESGEQRGREEARGIAGLAQHSKASPTQLELERHNNMQSMQRLHSTRMHRGVLTLQSRSLLS
eukprot:3933629-Rhodomonas_salina.3